MHLDPALIAGELAPDVDTVGPLGIHLHSGIDAQHILHSAVGGVIRVNVQRCNGDGAAEGRQGHVCRLLGAVVESAALGPTGDGANRGLEPDLIVDNGTVGDDEGVAPYQLQQLGAGLCHSFLVDGHGLSRDLAQSADACISLYRVVGTAAAVVGAVLDLILGAGIQLDIVHVYPALAVHQAPAVFQLGNGHTLAHADGGHQAALDLGGVTDVDGHGAVDNGAVFLGCGGTVI